MNQSKIWNFIPKRDLLKSSNPGYSIKVKPFGLIFNGPVFQGAYNNICMKITDIIRTFKDRNMARKTEVDIEIDRLSNSIVNALSGDVFDTEFHKVSKKEIKKKDWLFDWNIDLSDRKCEVYKMTIKDNVKIIQGLVSLIIKQEEKYVFVNLVENAKFNRGKNKLYEGVGGNMFAFACKKSKDLGFGGFVAFEAKTTLKLYYNKTLGAEIALGQRMYIGEEAANKLINQYFNN